MLWRCNLYIKTAYQRYEVMLQKYKYEISGGSKDFILLGTYLFVKSYFWKGPGACFFEKKREWFFGYLNGIFCIVEAHGEKSVKAIFKQRQILTSKHMAINSIQLENSETILYIRSKFSRIYVYICTQDCLLTIFQHLAKFFIGLERRKSYSLGSIRLGRVGHLP